jgi:hypothetical protein
MLNRSAEILIATIILVFALFVALLWVPLDSETPAIYTFRRRTNIGDAFLPLVAAVGMAIFAVIHVILSWRRAQGDGSDVPVDSLSLLYLLIFFGIMAVSLGLMFWSGPLLVALFFGSGEGIPTYREMRGSVPWKYIGFVLGGTVMVFGLMTLVEGRMRWNRLMIAVLSVVILILIFDVPFDTILLPPNGDF